MEKIKGKIREQVIDQIKDEISCQYNEKKKILKLTVPFPHPDGEVPELGIKLDETSSKFLISDLGFCDEFLTCYMIDLFQPDKEKEKLCGKINSIKKRYNLTFEKGCVILRATETTLSHIILEMCFAINSFCSLRHLNDEIRFIIPTSIDRAIIYALQDLERELTSIWGKKLNEAFETGKESYNLDKVRVQVAEIIEVKIQDCLKDLRGESKLLMTQILN